MIASIAGERFRGLIYKDTLTTFKMFMVARHQDIRATHYAWQYLARDATSLGADTFAFGLRYKIRGALLKQHAAFGIHVEQSDPDVKKMVIPAGTVHRRGPGIDSPLSAPGGYLESDRTSSSDWHRGVRYQSHSLR